VNGIHCTQSTKIQSAEKVHWEERQEGDSHYFCCMQGKLVGSTIWIREQDQHDKNRYCSIVLGEADHATLYDSGLCRLLVVDGCDEIKSRPARSKIASDYIFYVHVNDEKSGRFLDCINLMNKYSPIGKEALSTISKLVMGYAIEGNVSVLFWPIFRFFMAMNALNFPKEITTFIYQLFMLSKYQSTRIEFAKNNSRQYYKELLQEPKRQQSTQTRY
jgi:hypothetical protein